jgi:hypothetical protein
MEGLSRSLLCLQGHVYLNQMTEEATLRDRLGFHELTVARRVLPWFVERYREKLRPDEAKLLELWGRGHPFSYLLESIDGLERFFPQTA